MGLGFYAANIARYALFYGGLAAIIIVLLWLWLWSTAIVIGAELNVALEDVALSRTNRASLGGQDDSFGGGRTAVTPDADSEI